MYVVHLHGNGLSIYFDTILEKLNIVYKRINIVFNNVIPT